MAIRIFAVRRDEPSTLLTPTLVELPALLEDTSVHVWVDIDTQGPETQRLLADVFKFHPLLIEDAFADATTPKIDNFKTYLYFIVHGLTDGGAKQADGEVHTADLDLFLGERYLITHYRFQFKALGVARAAIREHPELLAKGPAFVAHRVLDPLIDEFLPLMEKLDAEIDAIENAIVHKPDARLLERIFRMKHTLQRIRRIGLHQKQLLHRLSRGEFALVPAETLPFFSDVYDHFVRVTDLTDVYRDLMSHSMDAYLGIQSHQLNQVMRILTAFSTVMLPLTFISGVYGMNFDDLPGRGWHYGFYACLGGMLGVALAMIVFFKRRRWV